MNHDIESLETSDSEPLDFSAVQALLASAQPDDCQTCSGHGVVGCPPDDYFSCPDCTPQQAEAPKAGAVPDVWISEVCGPEVDDLSYGQGYRRGWNDCRAAVLAAPQPQPVAPAPAIAPACACEKYGDWRVDSVEACLIDDFEDEGQNHRADARRIVARIDGWEEEGRIGAKGEPASAPADERPAFKAWADKNAVLSLSINKENGAYLSLRTQTAWESWQARAALAAKGGA